MKNGINVSVKMSDFTKEELNDLYAAIRHCYKQHIDLPSDTETERFSYDLMEKINIMINTYCDHSHKQYYEQVNIYECENCHMVML